MIAVNFRHSFLLLGLAAWFGSSALADDVRVMSTFDKQSVRVNEEIHLTIRVLNGTGNIPAPRLPAFKGFDTYYTGRASHLSFINGQTSSTVDFSYVLVPRIAGKYTLNPIEVTVGSRVFRTEAITIEVAAAPVAAAPANPASPAAARPPAPAGSAGSSAAAVPAATAPAPAAPAAASYQPPAVQPPVVSGGQDDNIFVQAWVDKNTAYPNEQVLLTYSLYTRYDTRYEGFEEEPAISGFWIEEFPLEKDIERQTVRVNGKRYMKADIRKIALFPTAAADYTIQPGSIKASIRQEPDRSSVFDDFFNDSFFSGGSFFARRENRLLTPPPIQVKVKALPEAGKPESFQGAVGRFTMKSSIDKTAVKQNEPVTLRLEIEGEGNIETINKPKVPELKDFKIYDADTSSQLFKSGVVIAGRKTFEIVFIPKKPGQVGVPPLEFSFFNPVTHRYETLRSQVFQLEVTPSDETFEMPSSLSGQELFKKDIRVEGRDILYIREKLSDGSGARLFRAAEKGLAWGNLALIVLWLLGLWRVAREERFSKDTALRRRKTAKLNASARMRKLQSLMRRHDSTPAYFEEVDKTLTQYLSDKFNLSTYGGTRDEVERQLEGRLGTRDDLYGEIQRLYRLCDESRFGLAQASEDDKRDALKILRQTVSRIEKVIR